jgi:hypothetical protein
MLISEMKYAEGQTPHPSCKLIKILLLSYYAHKNPTRGEQMSNRNTIVGFLQQSASDFYDCSYNLS